VPLVTVIKEITRLILDHRRNLARPHLPSTGPSSRISEYVC
jgi:hypothetical protein